MSTKTTGFAGEHKTRLYYEKLGYECLEQNYRYKRSEIDLIMLAPNENLLVFIEVKSRSGNRFGEPESFVSVKQEERIKEAAEDYILAINWQKDVRFDIASVDASGKIEVFQDAF
ncbi:MAG: YraN family protein [Bacteroidota bacterium]